MSKSKSSSDKKIRVGVADKSPLIQAALTHLFAEDERFELINVWTDGEAFLQSIDQYSLDVAITGWVIGPGGGKYILDQLRAHANAPRIVIYTGAEGESVPVQVMAHSSQPFDDADEAGVGSTLGPRRWPDEQTNRCRTGNFTQYCQISCQEPVRKIGCAESQPGDCAVPEILVPLPINSGSLLPTPFS